MNTKRTAWLGIASILVFSFATWAGAAVGSDLLEAGWAKPPVEAKLRAYWWWLNGNVTKASITHDLEEMAAKGFGGALICDAGGAEQDGNDPVPHGPTFFTPEWRELYKHALAEADRLGLEMSLNIQSGWNLGGPTVKPEDATKRVVWSELKTTGPTSLERKLDEPKHPREFYRDLFVLAWPIKSNAANHQPLQSWQEKTLSKALHFSAPDTSSLLTDLPDTPGEEDLLSKDVVDLTVKVRDGTLTWDVPAGEWQIIRLGCTLNGSCRVSTCSDGWQGFAIDCFDAGAFRRYWQAIVEPLIADAGPFAGKTLKYLHTDSWEVEVANWTPILREAFQQRRGYDLLAYLPAMTGRIVDSRSVTNRFLNDYRKTMGDLAVDNHYRLFSKWAAEHNLQLHPEAGGPHAVPIDSLRCLGMDDAPMSEFWARSWRHRVADEARFFVKQPASAAHTYGRRFVLAEGFTTIGPHWQETPADNLKPSFDRACCEGLNRLVWHAFTCSPKEMGLPGQEYFAGTHFNPQATWWSRSGPFLAYIDRCQFMLQQGLFVADAVYYYGDHVPNFTQLRSSDPAKVGAGYDYDVATEEVLLTRASVRDGCIVLPDGMSYRLLVLPDRPAISLPVLRKVKELVAAGATVIGGRPASASSLQEYPACDAEVKRIAAQLWGDADGKSASQHGFGKGRVFSGYTARQVLQADNVPPDCSVASIATSQPAEPENVMGKILDYIHRHDGDADIYFVCNRLGGEVNADMRFRVTGKIPELWDAVTGEHRELPSYLVADGCTTVPLQFAAYGSWFIIFRKPAAAPVAANKPNFRTFTEVQQLDGAWTVHFDPKWGGPESVQFDKLISWTQRPEEGIRHYSGTATYATTFDYTGPSDMPQTWLDLGSVQHIAEVRLNGKNLGVLWALPLRVKITEALKPAGNQLEIDVVNFWPNRVIGDAALPPEQRRTHTNIRKFTKDSPLVESGLLGPVRILAAEN